MDGSFKYKAFISYSHKDAKTASWLHRRLERYQLPKSKIGTETPRGRVPSSLKPIFRDRDELTAGASLGAVIEEALTQSENLIVICSPNAANSHWVNQEILYFKKLGREANIIPVVIDGEPFASNLPYSRGDEAFPEALRFEMGDDGELSDRPAEPLAADLRPDGDGRRLGTLKLISGLAGLGLDDLVQRDLQRARRRVMWITGAAASILLIMGSLTWIAIDARGEAEQRRADAEGQIEFMLTDLKEKLDEVGRLDILQAVGERAVDYYNKYDIAEHDDDALGRRARALHLIGQIEDDSGRLEQAHQTFIESYESTLELLARNPMDPDRIFEHAQSSFWVGNPYYKSGKYSRAETYYKEYLGLAELLSQVEPESQRSRQEIAYAQTGLGDIAERLNNNKKAYEWYVKALPAFEKIAHDNPINSDIQYDLADQYGLISGVLSAEGELNKAKGFREKQLQLLLSVLDANPENYFITQRTFSTYNGLLNLTVHLGDIEASLKYFNQALELFELLMQVDNTNVRSIIIGEYIYHQGAHIYLLQGKFEQVEFYLSKAENLNAERGENSSTEINSIFHNPFERARIRFYMSLMKGESFLAQQYFGEMKNLIDLFVSQSSNTLLVARKENEMLLMEALLKDSSVPIFNILNSTTQSNADHVSKWTHPDLILMIEHFGIPENEYDHLSLSNFEFSTNRRFRKAYQALYRN